MDALEASGNGVRAGALAEQAYRQFADHPEPATAAVIHLRAAVYREFFDSPAAGLSLISEALRLFDGTPPSAEHARAWHLYATVRRHAEGRHSAEGVAALHHALEVAEAAGAATQIASILSGLADLSFDRGEVDEALRLLAQARSIPEASRDAWAIGWLATVETDGLLKMGRLESATRVALREVALLRQLGSGNNLDLSIVLADGVEGLLGRGRTAEGAALIDPHTSGSIDRDSLPLHWLRAEIDLLRGEVTSAAERLSQMEMPSHLDLAREFAQRVAEVAMWEGRTGEALEEVCRQLDLQMEATDWVIFCGWLLALGMRACADLAERGRARRDEPAVQAALAAADDLASWVDGMGAPFTEHPLVATIPAARATWQAERSRAAEASDPEAWSVAAERWEALDYRHRAGYARWRQADLLAMPRGGQGAAATVLSTAAGLAVEHVPLMTAIQDLARRARIDLSAPTQPVPHDEPAATRAFGLTDRELDVLRLLGQGKTNPEIAAALFISPRTAGVHVTHILRKLDATTRVQAATIAERAGLLDVGKAEGPLAHT